MKSFLISLGLLFLVNAFVNAQQQSPILTVKATVNAIDTINCYIIIKATSLKDRKGYTILSESHKTDSLTDKKKNSCIVRKGKSYTFLLQSMSVIKISSEKSMFINLRSFDIGNKHILNNGELPYLALNMSNYRIYY